MNADQQTVGRWAGGLALVALALVLFMGAALVVGGVLRGWATTRMWNAARTSKR